ncbi:2TM domain-containing protein [Maribacter sp. PR1]|uniref:2TM domain-containing protein n=1 Tax=Maribacter cobaltidurans TaxID=1178778 RepID=A0ABU7IUZ1_9FLAO|nr:MULTISPECIES: 2TM domain-containing protein [Maribacter]MDC6389418.1 2TM domain-containing protein [Maribacter sp. PR1]MEE1976807.1 2TM domain-containing protein [Maribacter cobaltidurans]
MINKNQESKYYRAKERVECIKKFYTSLLSYVIFIAFLAGLNYWIDEWNYPWFLWAAFGWGIGLIFQAVKAFGFNPILGKDWETRKINELMKEEEEQTKWR